MGFLFFRKNNTTKLVFVIVGLLLISLAIGSFIFKNRFFQKQQNIKEQIIDTNKIPPKLSEESLTKLSTIKELGISFEHPKVWGDLVIELYPKNILGEPPTDQIFLWFNKYYYLSPPIQFRALNNLNADYVWEGPTPLYQYAGQPLEAACYNKAYLYYSDAKLTECQFSSSKSGTPIVIFKGNLPRHLNTMNPSPEPEIIPPEERRLIYFKGVLLQTKSAKWPGLTIYFESTSTTEFTQFENAFDKIIESLSYAK